MIDESTLVWGQGLQDWLPVRNVRTLVPQIRTAEGAPRNLGIVISHLGACCQCLDYAVPGARLC